MNAQHTVNVTNDFGDDKVWLPLLKIGFVYGLVWVKRVSQGATKAVSCGDEN